VLSFPFDNSFIFPNEAEESETVSTPSIGIIFPNPSFSRLGNFNPLTERAMFPKVLLL